MLSLTLKTLKGDQQTQLAYCGFDSAATLELFNVLVPKLDLETAKTYEHERRLLGPYFEMTQRGIQLDPVEKEKFLSANGGELERLRAWWKKLCLGTLGAEVNINSSPQLKKLFYEDLGIAPIKHSKKGVVTVTTNRKALEQIAEKFDRGAPYALTILALRDLETIEEVLTKKLLDGRWMFSLNIAGTETGRRSSNKHPFRVGASIQNISKKLRHLFVPDPGKVFIQVDQQGAESRGVAYLSGDENYIKAVESGDIHTQVAAMIFKIPPTFEAAKRLYYRDISYRQMCKIGGHGTNYYGQAATIARLMRVEKVVIEEFQSLYFGTFPGIQDGHVWVRQQIQRAPHCLTTPFGRRRRFWGRPWDDATLREAIAYRPQSITGELSSYAACFLWRVKGLDLMQETHDSLLLQVDETRLEEIKVEIQEILQSMTFNVEDIKGVTREVLIPWDMAVGYNWGEFDEEFPDKNPRGLRKCK